MGLLRTANLIFPFTPLNAIDYPEEVGFHVTDCCVLFLELWICHLQQP